MDRSTVRAWLRIAAAFAACSASVLAGSAARAAPQTFVSLAYETPPDAGACPDGEEFRASVQRQLGYDPFRPDADRRVEVQIAHTATGFDGRIRWSDAQGRWVGDRRLSSRRSECGEIAASTAFAVVVQIQLLTALAPPTPPPPPAPPPPPRAPEASLTAASPSPAPPPPVAPRVLRLFVGIGPSLALGLGPQPTGLGRVFVSGRLTRLSFELAADAALPTTQAQAGGGGFTLDRYAAGAAACGHARAFAACLTGTLGLLQARGFGVDQPASPWGWFSAVGGRIAATREIGRFFLAGRVEALVLLAPWTVTLNQTTAWTTPRVSGLAGVDVGARFF